MPHPTTQRGVPMVHPQAVPAAEGSSSRSERTTTSYVNAITRCELPPAVQPVRSRTRSGRSDVASNRPHTLEATRRIELLCKALQASA